MGKTLKFNDTNQCKLWVTGCLHGFHRREFIWQKRGYKSPQEHIEGLISIINSYCKKTGVTRHR